MPFDSCKIPKYALISCAKFEASTSATLNTLLKERVCTICHRSGFTSTLAYLDHKNLHSQHRPYRCECGFDSNLLTNMILHLKKEGCLLDNTIWPPYAEVYKKARDEKLRSFEKKSRGQKRVSFAMDLPPPKQLKLDSDQQYSCWECDYRTNTTLKVYKHYETRHAEKTIECSDCNKMFTSQIKLIFHKKKMHTDMVQCEICDLLVPRLRLQKHINAKHKKPFKCDDCSALFAYEKTMLTHKERMHKVNHVEELFVPCPLCEKEVDINNVPFECHMASRFHWIYEASWMEYNDIDVIPCYDCGEWETTSFETALRHFSVEHKRGTKDALEFLGILGKQDPDLVNTVKQKQTECLGFPNGKECQNVEEEKVLLQTKFIKNATCFMCYQMIPLGDKKKLDSCIIRHTERKQHQNYIDKWHSIVGLECYPCQDCPITSLTSLHMAFVHAKQAHENSYFEYFEYLRSQVAPAPDSMNKIKCFICTEKVRDLRLHISGSLSHKCAERKWFRSSNRTAIPCAFCPIKSESIAEAAQHAFKEHKQPLLEYMQYLEIKTCDFDDSGSQSSSITHDQNGSSEKPV